MSNSHKILIIDDKKNIRTALTSIFEKKGHESLAAENGELGLKILEEQQVDVVLLDIQMPGMGGMEVLKIVRRKYPHLPVIIITAFGSVSNAVEAIQLGAYDYVEKPLDADKILVIIKNAVERTYLFRENLQLRRNILERYRMVGKSPAMKRIFQQIDLLAPQNCAVLITGETGTGKELVARSLHNLSPRITRPFVKVNCAALPSELIESELFGHRKGAFTGAFQDKPGKFERADGGTIFLDEIGEISPAVQAKLLQVLDDGSFTRLGDVIERKVDVRVIAATNRDLEAEVEARRYRMDLLYRLKTTHIHIPPLRERREDIPELLNHYLGRLCDEMNLPPREFTPDAIHQFLELSWPGNVRELEHKLQEMLIYHEGEKLDGNYVRDWLFRAKGLSSEKTGDDSGSLRDAREQFEKEYIQKALISHDWNIPAAADYLGIERSNLYRKMRDLGIPHSNE